MSALYTTRVNVTGGRAGHVKSDDGILDLKLALPKELGGTGGATNPEQLFAAGYGACFENAILHVAKLQHIKLEDVKMKAEVQLHKNEPAGYKLAVHLGIIIQGLDQSSAEALVQQAHDICPYSNAVRGNIDVKLQVQVE